MISDGVTLGAYRVLHKLGEGGMGAVYVAEHALLGRRAAIKVLLPALSQDQEIVQRFFNEARAVTQIADPGIVQLFDFGFHTDGSAYIVMELLAGEPLDRRLTRLGRIAPVDVLRIARQLSTSLHAAHRKGIIHRDLKPENIFLVGDPAVTGGERAKILDFGIAKLTGDEPGRLKTRTNMVMGTPVFMSPEQCRGAGSVDHRSDIYSLGCVMMMMLTGRPPFEAEGSGELIAAHLREPPPLASSRLPGLPGVLDDLMHRCLAKSPDARFQTMAELAEALAAVEQLLLSPGVPPAPTRTTLGAASGQLTPGPRPKRDLAMLGVGIAVIAGAVVFAMTRGPGAPAATPAARSVATPAAKPAPPPPPADAGAAPAAQIVSAPPKAARPAHVAVERPPAHRHTKPPRHAAQGGSSRVQPAPSDLAPVDRGD